MALVTAHELHLTRHDHEVVLGVTFELVGAHAIVLGAPAALFAAIAEGHAPSRGRLELGTPMLHAGSIRTLPPSWTVLEWIEWRGRLAGMPARVARTRAVELLEAFELGAHRTTKLSKITPLVKRALPLVAALAIQLPDSADATVVFDDAFTGLDDASAQHLAALLVGLLGSRRWIGLLPFLAPRSALAEAADEVVIFDAGHVVMQGAPAALLAAERTFVVRVLGGEVPWSDKLRELGVTLVAERPFSRDEAQGLELTVAFSAETGPSDLLAIAASSADVIVDLFPASSKLA